MKARRKLVMLMVVAALGAMGFMPAHASGKHAACVTIATVTLTNNENLAFVDGGAGTLSGTISCEGDLSGTQIPLSGPFSFCTHQLANPHVNPKCPDGSAEDTTEPIYDAVTSTGAGQVVAHINGTISFSLGSVGCSFSILGHTLGTVAELQMKNFKCNTAGHTDGNYFGGPTGASTARSQALSEIIFNTNPCSGGDPQLCFKELDFQGISEMAD